MAIFSLLETAMLIVVSVAAYHFYTRHRNNKQASFSFPQGTVLSAHFLMNALDGLPRTIEADSHKALLYSRNLAEVLKYYIKYTNQPSVSLQQELELLKKYFSLLQEIYSNNIQLETDTSASIIQQLKDYRIIPMSIQLAVENAVKHNLPTKGNCLSIKITINEKGVTVTNNKSHLKKIKLQPASGFGLCYLKNKTMAIMQRPLHTEETKNIYKIYFPITNQNCPDEYSFDRRQPAISKGTDRKVVAV